MIELHACPFRSVAERHPDVVCSLHLGLIRGALEGMTPQPTTTSLTPFLRPGVCLARIEPVAARDSRPSRGEQA
jgi:predicted ArsR family transcriptional regulator